MTDLLRFASRRSWKVEDIGTDSHVAYHPTIRQLTLGG
jgi:hypothetical protein